MARAAPGLRSLLFTTLNLWVHLVSSGKHETCDGESCPSVAQPSQTTSTKSMVSVLTPTRKETQKWHGLLYQCFDHQTYSNKELIVADTSPKPSKFFRALNDSRVTYLFLESDKMSLGEKRNLLGKKANGLYLAHFDDDDWYGPRYLETMVAAL
mmetsp:Transcript_14640/g.22744  ORF Transcript_14640/g.22744 Transcript_14640/m.22744 type:complete len:154 (-) Transcript_14640:614-1075(-)